MSTFKSRISLMAVVLCLLAASMALEAQMVVGTWMRKPTQTSPGEMTMTVEPCCGNGYKLTYRIATGDRKTVLTVSSPFDGSEVPVIADGKPSGETMAIKRVDDHHAFTILKLNGERFGTSSSTLSADGRTITVVNDMTSAGGGNPEGKVTEIWVKQ